MRLVPTSMWTVGVVGLAAILVGCGPRHGTVSGMVTVDGRPLDYGMVDFTALGGVASAPVVDGRFTVERVPVGHATVTVRSVPRPVVAERSTTANTFQGPIPDRYMMPEQSGLSLEVSAGSQRHDVPVSSR